ncbi:hypothetical protein N181_12855 [Sinorhizobium fredii USDA 205]|nr:hypothetical protein N181_12855 [Sinorhizobium fredii USDA 205]
MIEVRVTAADEPIIFAGAVTETPSQELSR